MDKHSHKIENADLLKAERNFPLKISMIYFVIAIINIIVFDTILYSYRDEIRLQKLINFDIVKDLAYILITAVIIYIISRNKFEKINTAQKELIKSQKRYYNLIQTMREGVMYVDNDDVIKFVNEKFCEMVDYKREELIEKKAKDMLLQEADKEKAEKKNHERQLGISDEYELKVRKKNGDIIIMSVNGAPIKDSDGNVIGSVSTHTDVTERKKNENQLRESEEMYRLLAENSRDLISKLTPEGVFTYVSPALESLLGYEPEKVLGEPVVKFIHPEDRVIAKNLHLQAFNAADNFKIIAYRIKNKDGNYCWCETTFRMVIDPETGRTTEVVCVTRDITEQKEAEEKLKSKNQELNNFIYKVSHDLKGPLASAIGLINLAKDDTDPANHGQYIGMIDQSMARLNRILTDLIELLQIQEGKVSPEPVSFENFLKDILSGFEHLISSSNVSVNITNHQRIDFYSDKKILSSVLQNLIINAINYRKEYTPNPFVNITIEDQDKGVKITIEDNGIGIREEDKEKIFDMFFRATTKSSGTGLGLYIVKNGLEKLKGSIEVESEEEKGTCFILHLPNLE